MGSSVPKTIGIETEYGVVGGEDRDPFRASARLVDTYALANGLTTRWNFDGEQPSLDARGFWAVPTSAPAIEASMVNIVLLNGARFYVDHAHPEYSSPECSTPLEATLYDVAGERIMAEALSAANQDLDANEQITLYKNNSDGKGNSYGCHENYLVSREVAFEDISRVLLVHFTTRIIYTGSGKVGIESKEGSSSAFQMSQRADFFEQVSGIETTMRRPIVNTRDEPHAEPGKYRRVHAIAGDANMSQLATFLKVGTTAVLLALLEQDGVHSFPLPPTDPVAAIKAVSQDLSLSYAIRDLNGTQKTALQLQRELLTMAQNFVRGGGGETVASRPELDRLINLWREVLDSLEGNQELAATVVDWVAKRNVVEGVQQRHELAPDDVRLKAIDLQYHDIRPSHSLSRLVQLQALFDEEEINRAMTSAPLQSRAQVRGQVLQKFGSAVLSSNWGSMTLLRSDGLAVEIPLPEPALSGLSAVIDAINSSDSVDAFIENVGL
jgi:proteasome accessory factor A